MRRHALSRKARVATSRQSPGGKPAKTLHDPPPLDRGANPPYLAPMHKLKLVVTPPRAASGPTRVSPMAADIFTSLDWSEPPKDMSKPLQALWWLKKGELRVGPEWEQAHGIVQ